MDRINLHLFEAFVNLPETNQIRLSTAIEALLQWRIACAPKKIAIWSLREGHISLTFPNYTNANINLLPKILLNVVILVYINHIFS